MPRGRRQIGSLEKRLSIFASRLRPFCRGTAPGGVYTTPGQEGEVQKDGDPPNARPHYLRPTLTPEAVKVEVRPLGKGGRTKHGRRCGKLRGAI
jgi:hypothetical protein